MATTTQLGHVAFRVRDLERSMAWYSAAFGAQEAFRGVDPDGTLQLIYLEFAPGQFIELFPGGNEPPAAVERVLGYVHTCLVVDDLTATLAHLATLGVTPTAPPRSGRAAQQLAFIDDPDGNQLELMEIPPSSTLYRARHGSAIRANPNHRAAREGGYRSGARGGSVNRIDRLTAILLLLQGRKRTAGEIAQRFEISRRTVLRDMQALSEMGIPLVADRGASGGYTLPPDYSLPPLALTLHEALLLRLALSGLERLTETPYKDERESLLAKVDTLLPRYARAQIDRDQQTLSLDIPSRPYQTPFLDRLVESAREGHWVVVRYRSENGESEQTLLPAQVRTTDGLWYCEAYSYERRETRTYRVDRMLDVRGALPPPGAAEAESGIVHVDPAAPEVRIALTARGVLRLEREQHLAKHVEVTATGGGRIRLHLRPAEYAWLVRILLNLGTEARVEEPEAVRRALRQAAQALLDYHAEW